MKFPTWAPAILVDLYNINLASKSVDLEPDFLIELTKKYNDFTKDKLDAIKRRMYRNREILPNDISNQILKYLLTDERMKPIWRKLEKRITNENFYYRFYHHCCDGVLNIYGDERLTPKERCNLFFEIASTAEKLNELLSSLKEFSNYSSIDQVTEETITSILKANGITDDVLDNIDFHTDMTGINGRAYYAKLAFPQYFPSMNKMLSDIHYQAIKYGNIKPLLKQPNSKNSDTNYFIRYLSKYLMDEYGQPLHEVVAVTTSVVLNTENDIDQDTVRHLVKQ